MTTLPPRVRNLRGIPHGRLTPDVYLRTEAGRAVWSCLCQCGNHVERNVYDLKRGRRNGCDTCCPPKASFSTHEERLEARRERNRQWRARERRCGTSTDPEAVRKSKQAKSRWGDIPAERQVSAKRAFIWHGKTVGEASNEAERSWLRRTFGE